MYDSSIARMAMTHAYRRCYALFVKPIDENRRDKFETYKVGGK